MSRLGSGSANLYIGGSGRIVYIFEGTLYRCACQPILINRGDLTEIEARSLLDKLLSMGIPHSESSPSLDEDIERVLVERNIPGREDMEKLNNQLEALAAKLDQLLKE